MKIVFMGTPSFAVPTLYKLSKSKHEIVAVITQPDRAVGRGKNVVFSPAKKFAEEKGIPVYQFEKIRRDGIETLKGLDADVFVTVAYGQILSQEILDMAPNGVINVHASLLPAYRGSAPVQWALISGEEKVGVTIMKTALSVDSGDMILAKKMDLSGDENADEVLEALSLLGADLLVEALSQIENKTAKFTKQNEQLASHFPMINKGDGELDFDETDKEVVNFIRGMTSNPSAYCKLNGARFKIIKAEVASGEYKGKTGEVVVSDQKEGLIVKCRQGAIKLITVQAENSKAMSAQDYLRGKPIPVNTMLI